MATINTYYTCYYLIPAGETLADVTGSIEPKPYLGLTPNGIKQAEKIAAHLKSYSFEKIYCSPWASAKKTAEILKGDRNIKIIYSSELTEFKYGSLIPPKKSTYEQSIKKAIANGEYNTREKRFSFKPVEDAETLTEAYERLCNFVNSIQPTADNQDYAVVAHARLIDSFISFFLVRDPSTCYVE
jgi:probable phosphoglycerate mutase